MTKKNENPPPSEEAKKNRPKPPPGPPGKKEKTTPYIIKETSDIEDIGIVNFFTRPRDFSDEQEVGVPIGELKLHVPRIITIWIECLCGHEFTKEIDCLDDTYSTTGKKLLCQQCDNIILIKKVGDSYCLLEYKSKQIVELEAALKIACHDSHQHAWRWWYNHCLDRAKTHLKVDL